MKAHPERARQRSAEPQPAGPIGGPPSTLNDAQKACYRELVTAAHAGTLSPADTFVVEMAAVLLEQFRRDPAGVSAAKLTRLQSLLASLGMSPADRSKVHATRGAGGAKPGRSAAGYFQ